jgi:hypothetical protein
MEKDSIIEDIEDLDVENVEVSQKKKEDIIIPAKKEDIVIPSDMKVCKRCWAKLPEKEVFNKRGESVCPICFAPTDWKR